MGDFLHPEQEVRTAARDGRVISMPMTSASTDGDQSISGSGPLRAFSLPAACPASPPPSWPLPGVCVGSAVREVEVRRGDDRVRFARTARMEETNLRAFG